MQMQDDGLQGDVGWEADTTEFKFICDWSDRQATIDDTPQHNHPPDHQMETQLKQRPKFILHVKLPVLIEVLPLVRMSLII